MIFSDSKCKTHQFKSEVQQVLMVESKVLRKVFNSQAIFWVCDRLTTGCGFHVNLMQDFEQQGQIEYSMG
jgi:hypothetical protein